jgi:hypothetical protein
MPKEQADLLKPMLGMTTVIFAVIGGFFQFRASRLSNQIDEFSDEMDDPRNCAQALASILDYKDVVVVNESVVRPSDGRRFPRHPRDVLQGMILPGFLYEIERERLIQLKAVQHGLIAPIPLDVVTPNSVPTFKVNFQPSSFRREPTPPPAPPKPMSRTEAGRQAIMGAGSFAAIGAFTVYIEFFRRSWWAIGTGVFALVSLAMFSEGFSAWRKAGLELGAKEPAKNSTDAATDPSASPE